MSLEAVNRGNIFRFLLKPCDSETFLTAIQDGFRQSELIHAERELLSKTLSGSIKVMVDILGVLSPSVFAQASRLRTLAREIATALNLLEQSWEIELAALLSQIGAVTIPRDILKRWQEGGFLTESETKMIRSIPQMGRALIKNIPRLENIAAAVGHQTCVYGGPNNPDVPAGENIPQIARILKVIIDYDRLIEKTSDPAIAFQTLLIHESEYDPDILAILRFLTSRPDLQSYRVSHPVKGEKEIYIEGLKVGMVLTRDVVDRNGALIVSKDTSVTEVLKYKLLNYFRAQAIEGPVYIESVF
jgi:response regulator RpfG family c-di-GMP phosphodiesterase